MFGPEFYPTPPDLAWKLLGKISDDAANYLEPEAGKGDLVDVIQARSENRYSSKTRVDCIEIQPELVAILKSKGYPVVGYDWLTYDGVCYYDAIVMNPPFSNGDDHLVRAWDFLHDGEIACLLDEETVKNPYTKVRQRLAGLIREHGTVEFLGAAFKQAQRKCDVKVALVYLKKVSDDDRADLWEVKTSERDPNVQAEPEQMLAIRDQLGNMEHYYNEANVHMLKAFEHARKASIYMDANGIGSRTGKENYATILELALSNVNHARAEFGRKHRKDAWTRVFEKMEFHKWLDKKQHDQFIRDIETNAQIPFTAANIKATLENIFQQRRRLFEQSCANVFDELTRYYNGNTSHTEGWKTNDSYKVNEKVVFPYGCQFDSRYFEKFELRWGTGLIDLYADLDRALAVLAGKRFEDVRTIGHALKTRFEQFSDKYNKLGVIYSTSTNRCESDFFEIKFWKKGTVHLKFKDKRLLHQFNVTASQGKRWLGERTQDKAEREQAEAEVRPSPAPDPADLFWNLDERIVINGKRES